MHHDLMARSILVYMTIWTRAFIVDEVRLPRELV
jgi:hypothetical protein